jgi:uncharacterized repeat protein (TIGR01451 family)
MNKKANKVKNAEQSRPAASPAQMRSRRFIIGLVLGVLLLSSMAVFGGSDVRRLFDNSRPLIKVVLSGTVERNKEKISVEKAGEVKSGEVLRWRLASENSGDIGAGDYKAVGQIPAGTVFIAGSAQGESALVTYSIDGGKTFSSQPTIEEKQADGSVRQVPAPVESYTQVRFESERPFNSGETLNAFYSVRVK